MESKIIQGDCLEVMRGMGSETVDLLVTDPPYGYSFMGKDWDRAVPSVEIWKESLRVLKPGAFAFVMSAPRQDVLSQMIVRLTEAGFDTHFTSLYWTYASGFPKAMNIGKMVDKRAGAEREVTGVKMTPSGQEYPRGYEVRDTPVPFERSDGLETAPATTEAKALDGSYGGFQPKPAVEVIIVAMKPLSEKTFVDQALKNGHGVTWLDKARIPTAESLGRPYGGDNEVYGEYSMPRGTRTGDGLTGRFPANLLVSDDVLNDGRKVAPAGNKKEVLREDAMFGGANGTNLRNTHGDSGSYSRFFSLDAWAKTLPFLIVPKASKREKNAGLEEFEEKTHGLREDGRFHSGGRTQDENGEWVETGSEPKPTKNSHATVKPLQLMSYLITLGSRPGDTVLDPFVGSGTTVCAAKMLGRKYIGIEREEEYVKIAEARIASVSSLTED